MPKSQKMVLRYLPSSFQYTFTLVVDCMLYHGQLVVAPEEFLITLASASVNISSDDPQRHGGCRPNRLGIETTLVAPKPIQNACQLFPMWSG